MADFVLPLSKAFGRLQQTTAEVARRGMKDPFEAGAAASDYLRLFGLVALGHVWARMAEVALAKKRPRTGKPTSTAPSWSPHGSSSNASCRRQAGCPQPSWQAAARCETSRTRHSDRLMV
jgi:hypothetical protein